MKNRLVLGFVYLLFILAVVPASAQEFGGIRGMVYDKDFEAPLAVAKITVPEVSRQVTGADQGNYVITDLPAGTYTLVFAKDGYTRQVKANVVVQAGRITEVDAYLAGEFTEMDEFIVQDLKIGGGTEAGLLTLRADSPGLIDSISSDLMKQAGAGDAAAALNLVTGATVQDGKFAVIRGLPDRFVSSQINGVRLPSADEDTRAVELDQFPSSVIESIRVSKTFTPDQQGDASGGAVNVVLKSIPDKPLLELGFSTGFNSQVIGRSDFLTSKGGGVGILQRDNAHRQPVGGNFAGPVGVSRGDSPIDWDFDLTLGGGHEFDTGLKVGGYFSMFYERDSFYHEGGKNDKYWVESVGAPMTPQFIQGSPSQGEFKTQLFDVTRGSEEVKWGGLAAIGAEYEGHSIKMLYMLTRVAEDEATLAEDTRGKEFFFPGHDPNDPSTPGHDQGLAAPFLRAETLSYTERETQTLQVNGRHPFLIEEFGFEDVFMFQGPELDWTLASSSASKFNQKRQFGSIFQPGVTIDLGPGNPPFVIPAKHIPLKTAENALLGNAQFIFKDIHEESEQFQINLKFPFNQWTGDKGYFKFGVFGDQVIRTFDQDTFSNFNNNDVEFEGDFDDSFSEAFPTLPSAGPIIAGPPFVDVDYRGEQNIQAYYGMLDLPFSSSFNIIGGVRLESTSISIVNDAEANATWVPPGAGNPAALGPGDADVNFEQDDLLPSLGFVFRPSEPWVFRASYSQTVARQTFKELSPIQQQEFLGGDVFIGNPDLKMSGVRNFDLRGDYTPYPGSLVSISYFQKDIKDPIEYVQRFAGFTFTTPVNFPKGTIHGMEFEVRQNLGELWEPFTGLSIGGNATLINSKVFLSQDEINAVGLTGVPKQTTRDMTNAPEHLYNIYLTYDIERTQTRLGLFYTVKGDTLVAGAGGQIPFTPNVYATEYGTLNFSITQSLGEYVKIKFQAKNLTNPKINEVYRFNGDDQLKTSYRKGIDFSIGISAEIPF